MAILKDRLTSLVCSNKLDELPSLKDLHHLKALHLKYNSFTQLPPQLAALPLLEQLDISGNQIRVLDDVLLLGLPKLRCVKAIDPPAHRPGAWWLGA